MTNNLQLRITAMEIKLRSAEEQMGRSFYKHCEPYEIDTDDPAWESTDILYNCKECGKESLSKDGSDFVCGECIQADRSVTTLEAK